MIDTPLQDVRVLDLTTTLYGPYTTQILGDLGADVIKIEAPGGDPVRKIGRQRNNDMGAVYLGCNRNKRSLVLNLKQPHARQALWTLISQADIFVHNMRPQKITALGFAPAVVCAKNQEIIYAGLYGYREGGPYSGKPAYDDVIQGEAGVADLFARRDGHPQLVPTAMADKNAALIAANGILAAYIKRLRSGRGVDIECTMFESMVSYNLVEHQQGLLFDPPNGDPGYARVLSAQRKPHPTLDGHICLLAYTDQQWRVFWQIIGKPELAGDARFSSINARSEHIDELYSLVSCALTQRTTADWLADFAAAQIPAGRVNRLEQLIDDPHLSAIDFFKPYQHATEGAMLMADAPWRLDGASLPIRHGPPALGAHSCEVLQQAGLSEQQIELALMH